MRHARRVLGAVLLLAAIACAHRRVVVAPRTEPQSADSSVVLKVSNDYTEEVVIFVRGIAQEYRLGTVDPGSDARFVVRQAWLFGADVEFVAETQGAFRARFRSGRLTLMPGDVVQWDIQGRPVS